MSTLIVDLPFDLDPDKARFLLSMALFQEGEISLGKAAEMADYSKRTYIELLGKRGISVINYSPDELDNEWSRWRDR